ncbi:hypothetical protein Ppa06_14970 [Planomonospora parontospora subsp. parontospora]|uniref:Uncharacterized protein n=3 Tax=Planomonospora parontospora TaxID=58119 RepID=A0AA37F3E8_9ACTN|nr:hypothetical protein [Planomonospora parontospora]GGK56810.1 hypothetical protein GCM10010126_15520 [Planomonospora parontospora]GII07699.1 hypothetical protein Ppa06_14970 [Planomonospora parontospora subsp. parontospora]
MAEMVPNPLHEALGEALRMVEPLLEEVEEAVETPFQAFHSGKVWTGPAAKRFDERLAHHRTRIRTSGEKVVSDLRQALARTPSQVTEEEARAIGARYGLL